VIVPAAVRRGENVNLMCLYDLEGDTLYSMKWYKGKREFYRFTPKKEPSLQTFPVPGIYVEVSFQAFILIILKSFIYVEVMGSSTYQKNYQSHTFFHTKNIIF